MDALEIHVWRRRMSLHREHLITEYEGVVDMETLVLWDGAIRLLFQVRRYLDELEKERKS